MKKFRVIVHMHGSEVIVHEGEFDPNAADMYIVRISPKDARHSLVVQEVRKALGMFEEAIIQEFERVPSSLKKKLQEYIPFDLWEFSKRMRDIRKDVQGSWKL